MSPSSGLAGRSSTPPPFSRGRSNSRSAHYVPAPTIHSPQSPPSLLSRLSQPPPTLSRSSRYNPPASSSQRSTTPTGRRGSFGAPSLSPTSAGRGVSREPLRVYGDSFVGVFGLLPRTTCRMTKFKGASAKGLLNPNSTLGAGEQLAMHLENERPSAICLVFGHVDLHINYLWQLKSKGSSAMKPSDFVRSVFSSYSNYIVNEVFPRMKPGSRIYVTAVTPPVVEDHYLELCIRKYSEKEGGASVLPPLSMAYHSHDLRTRQAMVKAFNQMLSIFCARYPTLEFVSINHHLTDGNERVSRDFIDKMDPTNIHLLWESTIGFWCREIDVLRGRSNLDSARLERSLDTFHNEKRERMLRHEITKGLVVA